MRVLKQSTAVTVLLGPFLDKTDGVTEEAGLGATGTELSKAGGAFAAGPTLGTYDSDGWYPIALTTTHTNTLGDLTVKVHDAATHLPVWAHFTVIPANAYDSMVSGSGVGMRSDVQGWLGTAPAAVTVAGVPEVDVTHWRGTAAAAPTVAGVPAVEVIDIAAAGQTDIRSAVGLATANLDTQLDAIPTAAEVWASAARTLTAATNITSTGGTTVPQTGDSFARIGANGVGLISVALADVTSDAVLADAVWNAATVTYGAAGSYGLLIETDLDATIGSRLATAGYTAPDNAGIAAILDDTGTSGVLLTVAERAAVADKLLGRSIAGAADGGRTVKDALRYSRNKVEITGAASPYTITVYAEDDVTPAWTGAVTTVTRDAMAAMDPT